MTDKEMVGAAGSLVTFAGCVPYALSTLRGHTKPHAFSWLIWAIATSIAVAAQLVKGSGAGAWPMACSAFFCCVIAVAGLMRGDLGATRLDRWMFATALLAIPLWYITSDACVALVLMMLIDALAFGMTMRKAWTRPQEEMAFSYVMYAVAMALSLFALQAHTVMTVLYPAFVLAANATTALLVFGRRRALSTYSSSQKSSASGSSSA